MSNYRCYHFGNYYLSGIQQGIQAAHAQTNMAKFYRHATPQGYDKMLNTEQVNMFWSWTGSPTMICLNGGNWQNLTDSKNFLMNTGSPSLSERYPFATFSEDQASLSGMLTNVAIVLPEKIWGAFNALVRGKKYSYQTDRGTRRNTYGTFAHFYDYAQTDSDVPEASALALYEEQHGHITVEDAMLIDFMRGFRLAS